MGGENQKYKIYFGTLEHIKNKEGYFIKNSQVGWNRGASNKLSSLAKS